MGWGRGGKKFGGYGGGGYKKSGYGGSGYGYKKSGGGYGSYGACYHCGQPGHWAPQCPTNNQRLSAAAAAASSSAGAASSSTAPAPVASIAQQGGMTQAQAERMRTSLEAAKARRGEAPKRWTNLPPNPDITQDYIDEHETSYGTLSVPIVGCQYYKGVIQQVFTPSRTPRPTPTLTPTPTPTVSVLRTPTPPVPLTLVLTPTPALSLTPTPLSLPLTPTLSYP